MKVTHRIPGPFRTSPQSLRSRGARGRSGGSPFIAGPFSAEALLTRYYQLANLLARYSPAMWHGSLVDAVQSTGASPPCKGDFGVYFAGG